MADRPPTPPEVKEHLRKEVGFGCPRCRSPFLEYHHFDPPWEDEHHFRKEGMIALCPECHKVARSWTKEKIRQLKTAKTTRRPVKGFFDAWEQDLQLFVRVGGEYAQGSEVLVQIGNEPIIRLARDPDTGWLRMSFILKNRRGRPVVAMDANEFTLRPDDVHDLDVKVSKHHLKVWLAPDDLGLEMSFRWLDWDSLQKKLRKDWGKAARSAKQDQKRFVATLPPEAQRFFMSQFQDDRKGSAQSRFKENALSMLRTWLTDNCMVEGKIPFLDINHLLIYHRRVTTLIKDGIRVGPFVRHGNLSFGNANNTIHIPAYDVVAKQQGSAYALSNGLAKDEDSSTQFQAEHFDGILKIVDGKTFQNCSFTDCHLIFKGGEPPKGGDNHFQNCLWVFDEAASNCQ
jgi:hypothetical protein